MAKVSIFVPVYNEEKIIRGNIKKIEDAARKSIKDFVGNVENGADIAIGSRYSGLKAKRESKRLAISFVYNKIMRILFLTKIKDHQCGFKAFKRELLPIISGM